VNTPPKLPERLAHDNAVWPQSQLTDRVLVRSAAALDHGQRTANHPLAFKIAKQQDRVGQVDAYQDPCHDSQVRGSSEASAERDPSRVAGKGIIPYIAESFITC
jgi:hypothetical protein